MSVLATVKLEKYILGCLLENPELLCKTKNYFMSTFGSALYEAIITLSHKNLILSNSNLLLEVHKTVESFTEEKLEEIRKCDYDLKSLETFYIPSLKKYYLFNSIKEKFVKELIKTVESKNEPDVDKLKDILRNAENTIQLIEGREEIELTLDNALDKLSVLLEKRKQGLNYNSTGDSLLNSVLTNQFESGEIGILQGRTSMGKSVFATKLVNGMINTYTPVIYLTLEMSAEAVMTSILCMRTQTPLSFFANKEKDEEKYQEQLVLLETERNKLLTEKRPFLLIDDPFITLNDIENLMIKYKKIWNVPHINIIVDLLDMVQDFKSKNENTAVAIQYAMDRTSEIVKRQHCFLLGIIQTKRSEISKPSTIESIDKFRPSLNDGKGSGAYEERPRLQMSIFRRKYYLERYFPDSPENDITEDIIEITILKQTSGAVGQRLKYLFSPATRTIIPYELSEKKDTK